MEKLTKREMALLKKVLKEHQLCIAGAISCIVGGDYEKDIPSLRKESKAISSIMNKLELLELKEVK